METVFNVYVHTTYINTTFLNVFDSLERPEHQPTKDTLRSIATFKSLLTCLRFSIIHAIALERTTYLYWYYQCIIFVLKVFVSALP